jgi:hypothetical protein
MLQRLCPSLAWTAAALGSEAGLVIAGEPVQRGLSGSSGWKQVLQVFTTYFDGRIPAP